MTYPTLEDTIAMVTEAFQGKVDRGENPMINHMQQVASYVSDIDEDTQHTAWLHDLIEDTKYTFQDLENLGYSPEIIEAVRLLTHLKKEMKYPEYIDRICQSQNMMAIYVKLADQRSNRDPHRWLLMNRYVQQALIKKYAGVEEKLMKAAVGL